MTTSPNRPPVPGQNALGQHTVQPTEEAAALERLADPALLATATTAAAPGVADGQRPSRPVIDDVAASITAAQAAASAQAQEILAAQAAQAAAAALAAQAAAAAQAQATSTPVRPLPVAPARAEPSLLAETDSDGRAVVLGRRPSKLRIGWHTASLSTLSTMGIASPATGLMLGVDHLSQSVQIKFFRAGLTRIVLVGGVWSAQMLAFRALAVGAQVVTMTVEPQAWLDFGERSASPAGRMVVLHGEQPGVAMGTARQPVLVIYDLGPAGPTTPAPAGPWQTQLTVVRRFDERSVPHVQRSDLLILQRLHAGEAAIAESALRLTEQSTRLLQRMDNDMLALIGGGANRYLWLRPTSVERQLLGAAWR